MVASGVCGQVRGDAYESSLGSDQVYFRQYSFVLGRPVMTQPGTFETATLPATQHGDGSPNPHVLFRKYMCQLTALISDAGMKVRIKHVEFTHPPDHSDPTVPAMGISNIPDTFRTIRTVRKMGRTTPCTLQVPFKKFQGRFRRRRTCDPTSSPCLPASTFSRLVVGHGHVSTIDSPVLRFSPTDLFAGPYRGTNRIYLMERPVESNGTRVDNPARKKCIEMAIELTRILVHFYEEMSTWPARDRMVPSFFPFFLFDGAVALAGALSQIPPHPRSAECLDLMNKAIDVLEGLAKSSEASVDGEAEIPKRAITVLRALIRAGGWEMKDNEKGPPVPLGTPGMVPRHNSHLNSASLTSLHSGSQSRASPMDSAPDFLSQASSPYFQATSTFAQSQERISPGGSPSPPRSDGSQSGASITPSASYTVHQSSFNGMYTSVNTGSNSGSSDIYPEIGSTGVQGGLNLGGQRSVAQSMVMPYDVLEGAQPTSTAQVMGFDIDWVRLAGMDHWYSGSMGSYGTGAVTGS